VGAAEALGGLRQNELDDSFRVREHIRIPEPDHTPALGLQISRSPRVTFRIFNVLTAVKLHRQLCSPARKVDDEGRFDVLAREGWTITRDQMPDRKFGLGGIVAQLSGAGGQRRIDSAVHGASVGWLRFARQPTPGTSLSGRGAPDTASDARN